MRRSPYGRGCGAGHVLQVPRGERVNNPRLDDFKFQVAPFITVCRVLISLSRPAWCFAVCIVVDGTAGRRVDCRLVSALGLHRDVTRAQVNAEASKLVVSNRRAVLEQEMKELSRGDVVEG